MARIDEIRELTRVRVLSFLREKEAVFWVFVFPMVLAAVLMFAFQQRALPASTIGHVAGSVDSALLETLGSDEAVIELREIETDELARKQLVEGGIDGLLLPPAEGSDVPRLSRDDARNEGLVAELRMMRMLGVVGGEGDEQDGLVTETVSDTGTRYIDFLFPGLLGMNLMGTGMWGIGFAVADIRRRKFLKRLMVTPMRKSSFFLGFINSRLVFLVLELTVLVGFAVWLLGVPFRGDVLSFAVVTLLGAATFAGLGILVASRARTIEGVSGLMNLVMMPMWLTSGVFFSYEKFPEWLHPVLQALPLTAANDALRAVMLEGQSLLQVGPELAVMAAWMVITFVVGLVIFRWE